MKFIFIYFMFFMVDYYLSVLQTFYSSFCGAVWKNGSPSGGDEKSGLLQVFGRDVFGQPDIVF